MVDGTEDNGLTSGGTGDGVVEEAPGTVTPEGTSEGDGSSQGTEEDYSFDRWSKEKGYKDADALGKAYGHANKQIETVQAENAKFREYIQSSIPWIQYAETKYAEESKAKGEGTTTPPGTADSKDPAVTRDMIKGITEEMIGPQIGKLQADVSRSNVKSILKTMREDKKAFPYMNKETEVEMNNVLGTTNKAFPVSEEGIRELYNAAVGRRLPTILKGFKDQVTNEISANLEGRAGGFIESDRVGEAGNVKTQHKDIVDSILNSSYGKSQI